VGDGILSVPTAERHPADLRPPIRVLVADDEEAIRTALCDLVLSEGYELVGNAGDAEQTIALVESTRPDVALLDVRMPGGGGAYVARKIREVSPATRVVGLSAYEDRATVVDMLRSGAVGYLVKGIAPPEILDAIGRAARGQASLSAAMAGEVIEALAEDTAERRAAEDVLRHSEEKIRGLLESAPDAVVIVDADGMISLVNQRTEEMFGYGREEILGRPIEKLLPERFHGRHVGHRDGYLADPRTRPMGLGLELAGRRKDGTEFPVDISLSAIETEEGRLATAFVRDIRERRSADELRTQTEQRFAALLESAPDGVIIVDNGARIVLVNAQTEKLFGYTRTELLGKPIETLLPERFRQRHLAHRDGYIDDPNTRPMGVGLDLAGRRKDASEFPVDISLSSIETPEGRLATAFVRDITDRVAHSRLQQELAERRLMTSHIVRAGEAERQRVAADIHDDSIQAITAAGMRLQLLRRSLSDPEQLKLLGELEKTIQLSIDRLRHLLFDLRPPALDREGLAEALRMYLEEIERDSPTKYELEDGLLSQPSEDVRVVLYRIAKEALANVRKHAEARSVRVKLADRDLGYRIQITDDGAGFVTEGSESAPGHLGLATMRERAELMGGWLQINSEPGDGTSVEFWVPAGTATPAGGD
jgi:PAS domain S-box-containing protein